MTPSIIPPTPAHEHRYTVLPSEKVELSVSYNLLIHLGLKILLPLFSLLFSLELARGRGHSKAD